MIWAILAALGVPLWLCAIGIFHAGFQQSEAAQAVWQRSGTRPPARQEALDPRARNLGLRRLRMARKPGRVERGTALDQ